MDINFWRRSFRSIVAHCRQMSAFFERYEEVMPMNPSVVRLTKLVILMSFAAHLAVSVSPKPNLEHR